MVSLFMKRDGRTLNHQTLETIRLMAVERVREGERAAEVIEAYRFNRTTIYKWLKAAFAPGGGIKALRSTKATGRPRSLSPAQERRVFRWINGRDPRQHGLDFGLWTRNVVAELIEKKFGVHLGASAVGDPTFLAGLRSGPQPRRTAVESCQTRRCREASPAEGREAARENRGAARETSEAAQPDPLILQRSICRLCWRLVSNIVRLLGTTEANVSRPGTAINHSKKTAPHRQVFRQARTRPG